MRGIWILGWICLVVGTVCAVEPQPLQFAGGTPQVKSVVKETKTEKKEVKPQQTPIGKLDVFNNSKTVGLIFSEVKKTSNKVKSDQKKYLDALETEKGKKARKKAEELLSRYQLLGMDDKGMEARTYNNVINANPQAAAQEMLNRIETTRRPDLTQEDIDFLAKFSDAYMTESMGMSIDELTNLYSDDDTDHPTVKGEHFWAL